MRRALVLTLLVVLAGCAAPVSDTTTTSTPVPDTGTPSDPATDTLGWEGGYWHNESIATDISDGLNATERNATVARSMARVEHIRGIEFQKPVPVDVISRETYRTNYSGSGNSSPAIRTFDNAKFEALFLVGETQDSLQQQEENRGSSVLGFYSPSKDQIVIISESKTPTIDEITLGHELTHAIQFRNFNPHYQNPTRDKASAHNGLIEGDARYTDQLYRDRCGQSWSCVKPAPNGGSGSGGSAGFHMGVYLMKYFPYSDGPGFVKHFREQGGWERVNQLYDEPPRSAEQVVYPEKYKQDTPTNVELADRSSGEWDRVTVKGRAPYGEVGMAGITAMFAYPAYEQSRNDVAPSNFVVGPREFLNYKGDSVNQEDPINYGIAYADGWDGDKMYIYENDAGETAYTWRLVWDSSADASEFANGYRDLLRYWGAEKVGDGRWRIPEDESEFADSFYIQVEGDTVTIVNAPSGADLSEVRSGTPS